MTADLRAQRFQAGAYPHWLDRAEEPPACRGEPIEIFFPAGNGPAAPRARAICASCPLLDECRDWALRQPIADLHGIWGGTTRREREAYRRQLRAQAQEAA